MLNLSPSQYIAEKDRSLSAVKCDEKNIQPYQWVIYKKINGRKGERVNIDTSKIPGGQAYNTYARSTENGIVINGVKFVEYKRHTSVPAHTRRQRARS